MNLHEMDQQAMTSDHQEPLTLSSSTRPDLRGRPFDQRRRWRRRLRLGAGAERGSHGATQRRPDSRRDLNRHPHIHPVNPRQTTAGTSQ